MARVQAANVANRGSWTYWNGVSWVAAIGSAAPMTLPDGVGGYTAPVVLHDDQP